MYQINKLNKLTKPGLFFTIFLLNIFFVSALGVSPASKTLNFQPNQSIELEFNIINSEKNTFIATLGASEEISSLLFFEEQTIPVDSSQFRVPFKVIVNFPYEMEPGVHRGTIGISPRFPELADKMFFAYIAPKIPIYIRVPYPAKYLSISLKTLNVDEGTPLPIYVVLDNLGSEKILKARAEVDIYDPQNQIIAHLNTKEASINPNSVLELQALPSIILKKGLYQAFVDVYYDGLNKSLKSNFTVSEPFVRIKELISDQLARDEINKVIFRAYNEWNTELTISGFIEINNRKTEMPVFKLDKYEEKEVSGFLDTTGIMPGDYNISITLIYANQIKTEFFSVKIKEKIPVTPLRPTKTLVLIIVIIFVLIIALLSVWLFIIKKRKLSRERNL